VKYNDFLGREIKEGDLVAFPLHSRNAIVLGRGKVLGRSKSMFGERPKIEIQVEYIGARNEHGLRKARIRPNAIIIYSRNKSE
jgi:hypothetical protein